MLRHRIRNKMLQVMYKPVAKEKSGSGGFKKTVEELDKAIGRSLEDIVGKKKKSGSDDKGDKEDEEKKEEEKKDGD